MTSQTTTIKNGTIVLPKAIRKAWQGADVFMLPDEDSILIKKIEKPLKRLSDLADRIKSPKMSQSEIENEIKAFRKSKDK